MYYSPNWVKLYNSWISINKFFLLLPLQHSWLIRKWNIGRDISWILNVDYAWKKRCWLIACWNIHWSMNQACLWSLWIIIDYLWTLLWCFSDWRCNFRFLMKLAKQTRVTGGWDKSLGKLGWILKKSSILDEK